MKEFKLFHGNKFEVKMLHINHSTMKSVDCDTMEPLILQRLSLTVTVYLNFFICTLLYYIK